MGRAGGDRRQREAGLQGQETPARTIFYASGLIFGINNGTCNYDYFLWLIVAIYVGSYQVSYMIILYP